MSVDTSNSSFQIEKTVAEAKVTGVHDSLLQECEKDIIWYRDNFFGKNHTNLLAYESVKGPLAVSIIKNGPTYKILVRSSKGSERMVVQYPSVISQSLFRKIFALGPTMREVLLAASPTLPVVSLKKCKDTNLPNELLAMEERQVIRSYKFGLCYLAPGQSTEQEMLQNRLEEVSPAFNQFLTFLGEKIELKGWKGYKAGLDINDGQTGTHSYYTKWQGYEIMFHVSPLLPFNVNDKQQLERKRHIGNDIVVIVFQDSDVPFQFSSVSSKQNHVFAFVKPQGDDYKLTIVSKNGVPVFKPDLPQQSAFDRSAVSRDFFLHKLVNGERASYNAPDFAPKIARTRSVLLADIAERFIK